LNSFGASNNWRQTFRMRKPVTFFSSFHLIHDASYLCWLLVPLILLLLIKVLVVVRDE
jgi:hypothetical protein